MANPFLRVIGFGLVAMSLAACSSEGGGNDEGEGDGDQPGETLVPPPGGQGQTPSATIAYPPGPYGIGQGSIIANYQFIGMPNSQVSGELKVLQLADFYNPTGNEMFPADHPYYAGQMKPKALLINIGSTWCPPCNEEAKSVLPPKYDLYKPQGGEFLFQLADGPTPGEPATITHLQNWTNKYNVTYPAVLDPTYKLGALFESDAFPANMLVDPRTMALVEVVSGAPTAAFWSKYEDLLAQ